MEGNYNNYEHPNLPINGYNPKDVSILNKTIQIERAVQIGPAVHTVAYSMTFRGYSSKSHFP